MTLAEILILVRALTIVACAIAAWATWRARHAPRRRDGDGPVGLVLTLAGFGLVGGSLIASALITVSTGGNAYWHHLTANAGALCLAVVQIRRAGTARAARQRARHG